MNKNPSGLVPYASPRLPLGARSEMKANDQQLQSLAYLCADRGFGPERVRTPIATCFAVSIENEERHIKWGYLVTARHVIEMEDSDVLYVRFNKKAGGTVDISVHRDDWSHHDTADVSAIWMPKSPAMSEVQLFPIPTNWFVGPGPDYRYAGPDSPVGGCCPAVGDEIIAMGLFVQDFGTDSNLPVARFGHIARMPSTMKIPRYEGDQSHSVGWLVDLLSWGGVSGSPVLWGHLISRPSWRSDTGALVNVHVGHLTTFLGLVHGHFHIKEKAEVQGDVLGEIRVKMNAGLAIITPACAIIELLDQDHFADIREYHIEESKAGRAGNITPDVTPEEIRARISKMGKKNRNADSEQSS